MRHIHAKKSLGQNFLQDRDVLETISSSIEVLGKHILEVGPGYGALTDFLIEKSPKRLDLIELDQDMVDILVERFGVKTMPQA
jgi:16S rRNA (adenine1518-N6/adenine1519-N6)-dimethyltransferase